MGFPTFGLLLYTLKIPKETVKARLFSASALRAREFGGPLGTGNSTKKTRYQFRTKDSIYFFLSHDLDRKPSSRGEARAGEADICADR